MAGMSRMDRGEPEARGEMTSAYNVLSYQGEKASQAGGRPLWP